MKQRQKALILLIIGISVFFLILFLLAMSYIFVRHGDNATGILYYFILYHNQFMFLLGIIGVALGGITYYSFFIHEKEYSEKVGISKEIILKFFDNDEKIVLNHIIKSGDNKIVQADISRIKEIGKVKAHRILNRFEEKGIIERIDIGKTNAIILDEKLKDIFINKKTKGE